jgi:hypothetical protein
MHLFWLTFDTPRGTEVYIVEAGHLMMARMKAGLAGQTGTFQEGHPLDAKTAKKIPNKMIGGSSLIREPARAADGCRTMLVNLY